MTGIMIKQIALANRWPKTRRYINSILEAAIHVSLVHILTLDTLKSPKISHNCFAADNPTVATVKKPNHLLLTAHPDPIPVHNNQNHHWGLKGLCTKNISIACDK